MPTPLPPKLARIVYKGFCQLQIKIDFQLLHFSEEELTELCMGGLRIIEKFMQHKGEKKYLYNVQF
jgi:hypothetical protein